MGRVTAELSLPRRTASRAKAGGKELGSWCLPQKAASRGYGVR